MKDIGEFTRLKPDSRVSSLLRFNRRITGNEKVIHLLSFFYFQPSSSTWFSCWIQTFFLYLQVQCELNNWGLELSKQLVQCQARRITPLNVVMGSGIKFEEGMGDWASKMRSKFNCSQNLCSFLTFRSSMSNSRLAFCCTLSPPRLMVRSVPA